MTIRKRNDSVKSGQGIDGDLGEDFVKPGPDQFYGYPGGQGSERSYAGAYTENKSGLTRTNAIESWETRDIMDDVIANSDIRGDSVNANSGPIKYGVNKPQRRR